SPTIYQWFVALALSPVQQAKPHVLLYDYMDNILIAAEKQDDMKETLALMTKTVKCAGFKIAQDKIQKMPPWQYLGWCIRSQTVQPQQLQIKKKKKKNSTLYEEQKLLGTINWVFCPSGTALVLQLGITNSDLASLFALLKGESDLSSPRHLNHEAQLALQKAADAIAHRQASQWAPDLPFLLIL
ncbi:POK18 protein, partial [Certhia familiaris]|nr:POK18 protein [Certhia familiaris]